MKKNHATNPENGLLNTLAQNGTSNNGKYVIIVNGKGGDLSKTGALQAKAKRKVISQKMSLALIDAVKEKNNQAEMSKGFWNTYHCQNKLTTANGRIYTKYCKNRHCAICNTNRTADIINRYMPIVEKWPDPYHVVLTMKSPPYYKLRDRFDGVLRYFNRIVGKYKTQNQREGTKRLIGLRSLECNYNPKTKTYNPHLHVIVPDKETADILVTEWLLECNKVKFYASKNAQWKSPLRENRNEGLMELVKYGTKIFTEPNPNKKVKGNGDRTIYAAAMLNILTSLKGLRLFERFGFNLPKESNKQSVGASVVQDYEDWIFTPEKHDWLNDKGKQLSNYIPDPQLLEILHNYIDINKE